MNNDNFFETICFLALMQSGDSPLQKHPAYIKSKLSMFDSPTLAYTKLDRANQNKVLAYYSKYNLQLPDCIKEYELDLAKFIIEQFNLTNTGE